MVISNEANGIKTDLLKRKKKLSIIGLGQVGLALALHFARAGCSVIGFDIDKRKIDLIEKGICPLNTPSIVEMFNQDKTRHNLQATSDLDEAVGNTYIHFLCLPTPLDNNKTPDLTPITISAEAVGRRLKKGSLVILESSVYPGVTRNIVQPILEKASGLRAGQDFGIAYCFERVDPGNSVHTVSNTPKVVGAIDKNSAAIASAIYSIIVKAPIKQVSNCETAELVKLVENIYRDINIAYANEIALLCAKIGVDVLEVMEAAATKWSFAPHIPSAGVGGACIPINPYYLLKCANDHGVDLKMVKKAREVNENMPHEVVNLVREALNKIKIPIEKAKICVCGLAYKPDINERRSAAGEFVARELQQLGAKVVCYDPVVTSVDNDLLLEASFEKAIKDSDCIVFTTEHTVFKNLDMVGITKLAHRPLALVDGKHVLIPSKVKEAGIVYFGLGRREDSGINIWNIKLEK